MSEADIPEGFSKESFSGFYLDDEEVGEGEFRAVAIEVKHCFEAMVQDADEKNEEFFLPIIVETALRNLLRNPCEWTITQLLVVSPSLYEPLLEITRLVSPSLLHRIPTVI